MNTDVRVVRLKVTAISLLSVCLLVLIPEKPACSATLGMPQDKSRPSEDVKQEGTSAPSPEGNLPKAEANEPQKSDPNKPATVADIKTIVSGEVAKVNEAAAGQFAGLHFGVGVSGTLTLGRDRIDGAKVVNGIVRVDGEKNFVPRVMLESHWFREGCKTPCIGPFVALQPGTNNIIDAIGAGIMFGLKHSDKADERKSYNLAIGVTAEPNVKTLGDGINKNQPLPTGESSTEVRTQNRTLIGIMALLSFGFF